MVNMMISYLLVNMAGKSSINTLKTNCLRPFLQKNCQTGQSSVRPCIVYPHELLE